MVEGHGDTPTVRMPVQSMRPGLTIQEKSVAREGSDDYAGSKGSEGPIINRHRLDGDGDARFGEDFYRPAGSCSLDRLAMLDQACDDHPDDRF